eukprot:m.30391 g.30391  ORF g.30391 m.30391 type:complete len:149 (+) comp16276_c0_seq1:569-1015(+)
MLRPVLDKHGVKLVAIGMEESLDDFVEGHFFEGDLYFDKEMECYKSLKLAKGSVLSTFGINDMRTVAAIKLAGKVPGNFKHAYSHGTQLGATYVVDTNGVVVFEHRQETFGDYVENHAVLTSLGLTPPSNLTRVTDLASKFDVALGGM